MDNVNIELLNRPRRSGKTTSLKLWIHENYRKYDTIIVRSANSNETIAMERYAKRYFPDRYIDTNIDCLRGKTSGRILIIIDEPFLMSCEEQQQFIDDVNIYADRIEKIKVFGIGTAPIEKPFEKIMKTGDCYYG